MNFISLGCEMLSVFLDGTFNVSPCNIKIDFESIRIEYEWEGISEAYIGKNNGTGHFYLIKEKGKGTASLHYESDNKTLVGLWQEEGHQGLWRISTEIKCRK